MQDRFNRRIDYRRRIGADRGFMVECFVFSRMRRTIRRIAADGIYRTIRCSRGGRGTRGVRGGHGGSAHGTENGAHHDEPGPDCADELQSRGRRRGKRPSGPRGGRAGWRDGRGDRRGRHSVPAAERLARSGGVESTSAVRQAALPGEDARGAGGTGGSAYTAGGSRQSGDR